MHLEFCSWIRFMSLLTLVTRDFPTWSEKFWRTRWISKTKRKLYKNISDHKSPPQEDRFDVKHFIESFSDSIQCMQDLDNNIPDHFSKKTRRQFAHFLNTEMKVKLWLFQLEAWGNKLILIAWRRPLVNVGRKVWKKTRENKEEKFCQIGT